MNIHMYTQRFALTALAALICHATVYAQTSGSVNSESQPDTSAVTAPGNDQTNAGSSAGVAAPSASPAPARVRAPRPTRSSATANKQISFSVQPAAKNAAGAEGNNAQGDMSVAATASDARAAADAATSKPAAGFESYEDGVRIMRGNDRVVSPPRLPARVEGPASTFKFEEAPISEVVHVMLGEILKVDYVLHQPVAGSVTLATRGNVSADQAIFLLESALQANGIVMARDARGVYHVGRAEALKGIVSAPRQVGFGALPPGSGAVIVPLQYIGAAEMATILRPMVAPDALLRVDTLRNLLVLGGTRTQAEGWLELINTFDVDLLKGMSVGLFPLKYATVREVEQALRLMTGGATAGAQSAQGAGGGGAAPASAGGAAAAAGGAASAATAESNPFFGAVRIMPLERISSILVVTPRASKLDEARKWIERFDRPSDNSTEPQLFVYPVQNGSAKHLASVLSGIFGGGGGQTATGGTGVAPGLGSSTSSTSGFGSQNQSQTGSLLGMNNNSNRATPGFGSQNNQSNQGGQGSAGVTAATLGQGGVRIIADEVNNAILIYAPRSEYAKLEASLRRLDIRSAQVLIEAMIVEVTLKDDLQYGLQWKFSDGFNFNNGYNGTGTLGTALTGTSPGFTYSLFKSATDIRATLSALAGKSLIKVISNPSVTVMDNQVATILVGDQIPIKTGETLINSTTANTVTNFQYKDTGVSLAVTPSVNAGNIVTMQVAQSITDVVGTPDTITGQRAFTQRQIGTKVAIRSGETLVLGGLIKDNTSTTKSGIPLLQDIPVAGKLFGSTQTSTNRTELLVILTPRVVRSDEDARELNEEMRNQMKTFTSVERLDARVRQPLASSDSGALSAPPFNKGVITP